MRALAFGPCRRFRAGCRVFGVLKRKRHLNERAAIQALRATFASACEPENTQEHPNGRRACGGVFAFLVECRLVQLSLFGGSSAIPFDIHFLAGFLDNARELELDRQIIQSPWMCQMRFRPELFSHLQLTDAIDSAGMAHCWPVYDAMAAVIAAMENDASPEGITDIIDDMAVARKRDFIEFAAEVVVIFKPVPYLEVFLRVVANDVATALTHIERIGDVHEWTPEQTAGEIRGLAGLVDFDTGNWRRRKGRASHERVRKFID
jgi:hypothetical protein